MTKQIFLSLFITMTSVGYSQLSWDEQDVSIRLSKNISKAIIDFKYQNNGASEIKILSVKTSCGCTVAEFSEEPIASNGIGMIKVAVDSAKVGGESLKYISVKTNEDTNNTYMLSIKTEIDSAVKLEPKSLSWKIGDPLTEKNIEINVQDDKNIHLLGVVSTNDVFIAKLVTKEPGKRYSVSVTPSRTDVSAKAHFRIEAKSGERPFYLADGIVE